MCVECSLIIDIRQDYENKIIFVIMGIYYVNFILTHRAGSPRYFGFSSDD